MSNLPSPFQHENMPSLINSSPNRPSSSPGFLMLTRPPQASIIGPDGKGRSMGRANYKPSHRNNSYPNKYLHNQNRSFDNYYRGQPNQYPNNHFQRSPSNEYMSKSYSFSASPNFHSTPRNYRQNNRRGNIFHQRSGFNQSKQKFERSPLKDVPIDKFISLDMVQDPWEEFESSNHNKTGSKVTSSDTDGVDAALSNISATINDTIDNHGSDDEKKGKNSTSHLNSKDANSSIHLFSSSPGKDKEIVNDC